MERRATAALENDTRRGFLEVHPLEDRHALDARDLLTKLRPIPLRTLDALYLAIALAIDAAAVATADDTFSKAAEALD
jgi:predicted nucleic acid-binding protein